MSQVKKRFSFKKRIEQLRAEVEGKLWLPDAGIREQVVAETCDYLLGEISESPIKSRVAKGKSELK